MNEEYDVKVYVEPDESLKKLLQIIDWIIKFLCSISEIREALPSWMCGPTTPYLTGYGNRCRELDKMHGESEEVKL